MTSKREKKKSNVLFIFYSQPKYSFLSNELGTSDDEVMKKFYLKRNSIIPQSNQPQKYLYRKNE